jgi:hypothetical protein
MVGIERALAGGTAPPGRRFVTMSLPDDDFAVRIFGGTPSDMAKELFRTPLSAACALEPATRLP